MLKIRTLIGFMVFGLILSIGFMADAKTPDGETPAEEDVCDGLSGAQYGLCNAYCEAMDCDSPEPNASDTACDRVLANFMDKADGENPPCTDPCAGLGECPCGFESVPKTPACWSGDIIQWHIVPPIPPRQSGVCLLESHLLLSPQFEVRIEVSSLPGAGGTCKISIFTFHEDCGPQTDTNIPLTDDDVDACKCQLQAYADDLHEVSGINIDPFSSIVCSP